VKKISQIIHLTAIAARQIGKVTWCTPGDEDTRFYHSRASAKFRSNLIKSAEEDGIRFFTHKENERVFTKFYHNLLGKPSVSQHLIDLDGMYEVTPALSSLSLPFSEQEIRKALKQILRDKSPGLNGFGSAFYQDFWDITKPDLLNFFTQFYSGHSQLGRCNRSFIVLIQKKRVHVHQMHTDQSPY
jgi:hypothetical protein